jgi:hypothetical protein
VSAGPSGSGKAKSGYVGAGMAGTRITGAPRSADPAMRGATITASWPSASRPRRMVSTAVGTPPSIGK